MANETTAAIGLGESWSTAQRASQPGPTESHSSTKSTMPSPHLADERSVAASGIRVQGLEGFIGFIGFIGVFMVLGAEGLCSLGFSVSCLQGLKF